MSAHEEHCRCGACLQATIAELEAKIDELSGVIGEMSNVTDGDRIAALEAENQLLRLPFRWCANCGKQESFIYLDLES